MQVSRSIALLRPLLALLALVIITGAFFTLPPSITNIFLLLIVGVALVIGARRVWRIRYTLTFPSRTSLQQRWQQVVPYVRLACSMMGGALLLVATYQFLPNQTISTAESGIALFIVGALLLGVAFAGEPLLIAEGTMRSTLHIAFPVRWRIVLLGVVALLAVIQTHFLLVNTKFSMMNSHLQFVLLVSGWSMVAGGLSGTHLPRWRMPKVNYPTRHAVLLIGVLLIAIYVRVYLLETGIHRWIDEIHSINAINEFKFEQPSLLMPFGGITAFTYLFPYVQWWWYQIFGASIASVRLPAVVFGIAQVAALYWLVATIANRRTALIAAFLFATFPPAIHFARIGINNVADPLFGILALGFMVRATRDGQRKDYVLAGLMLGLSHYFYEGGRLFFTLFAACWIVWIFLTARRSNRSGRQWLYGLLMLVLTITPLYSVWMFNNLSFFPRFSTVGRDANNMVQTLQQSQTDTRVIWEQIRNPLLTYVHTPESGWFYKNDMGYVLPYLVPFFLLGLAYCGWRWRTLGGGLLFWWCLAAAIANVFISNSTDAARYNIVFPVLCAVVALGIELTWLWLVRLLPHQRFRERVTVICVVSIGIVQAHYYLGYQMNSYHVGYFYTQFDLISKQKSQEHEDMIFRAVQLQSPVEVFVFARGFMNIYSFNATNTYFDRTAQSGYTFTWNYTYLMETTLAQTKKTDVPKAFFLEPQDKRALAYLQQQFVLYGPFYSTWDVPLDHQMALWVTDVDVLPSNK